MSVAQRESLELMTKSALLRWARKVRGYRIENTNGLLKEEVLRLVLALEAKRPA